MIELRAAGIATGALLAGGVVGALVPTSEHGDRRIVASELPRIAGATATGALVGVAGVAFAGVATPFHEIGMRTLMRHAAVPAAAGMAAFAGVLAIRSALGDSA